ncbi:hypothetical protein DL89DRAFT_265532, partial [Linderina pennispora]
AGFQNYQISHMEITHSDRRSTTSGTPCHTKYGASIFPSEEVTCPLTTKESSACRTYCSRWPNWCI